MRIQYNRLLAFQYSGRLNEFGVEIENTKEEGFDRALYEELEPWMEEDIKLREQHIASIVGDTVGDPLKDTSGPAINILVKLSAITSLVFGNYLNHYHIFCNPPKKITAASALLAHCNTAGDNPNVQEHIMIECKEWISKGYFGYNAEISTFPGYPKPVKKTDVKPAKK